MGAPNEPRTLSLDDKRQVISAAVLRHAPEAIPLRERVLDALVLGALVGSDSEEPFRVGKIKENVAGSTTTPLGIRDEVIQEALGRLVEAGKVKQIEFRKRHAYYLTEEAVESLAEAIHESERLVNAVFARHLRDTETFIAPAIAREILNSFILECFARSGRIIARSVAGVVATEDMARLVDARTAFQEAISRHRLSPSQIESLEPRCNAFLESTDPLDERLRFILAQAYYFAQLLGLEHRGFNPLAEHAFAGTTFFLDTNVILIGLVPSDVDEELFQEVLDIARRAGIRLVVTRETIEEIREYISRRLPELRKILTVVPAQVLSQTSDPVIRAYLRAREANANLSADAYVAGLGSFETTIRERWRLEVDDRRAQEIIGGRDPGDVAHAIQQAAISRGHEKSERVLMHDVAHYFAVKDERDRAPHAWFLSRDGSLPIAADRLAPNELPFCFHHLAFLQSLSPFVATPGEEYSFVDTFAALVNDQFKPMGAVFDASELVVLAEFHEDVMATPSDQLMLALDFVKSRTLQGRPYTEREIPRVSLELKKFLTSSREEQIESLRSELFGYRRQDKKHSRRIQRSCSGLGSLHRIQIPEVETAWIGQGRRRRTS